jgi:hypothetical protein
MSSFLPTGYLDFRTGVEKSLPATTATPTQLLAVAGGKGLVSFEALNERGLTAWVTWSSGTLTLPNEDGSWEIDGWFSGGITSGLSWNMVSATNVRSVNMLDASANFTNYIGAYGAIGFRNLTLKITHRKDSLFWGINGEINTESTDGQTGTLYASVLQTTSSSLTLSTYNISDWNINYRKIK